MVTTHCVYYDLYVTDALRWGNETETESETANFSFKFPISITISVRER